MLAPRDERLAAAFDAEIDSTRLLLKGPILELTPPYETGATPRELIEQGVLHPDFVRLDSPAFRIDQPLYVHQERAIRKFLAGRNLVVSTGTGSGKTECFLVPILNVLMEEHAEGGLGPGVRALLLYPMNALANDQLVRLRGLLANVPEITFGRYTGETVPNREAAEAEFLQTNPGQQRLPNELLSRDEMRKTPPHLLLTNYAMLEYLLLRPADIDLFDGPYSGTWRFIVMDEAHVYDGAQGSEVALLLRRLRQRVAPKTNLQCIATSASLVASVRNDPHREIMTFAHNLFDAPFEYVDGDSSRQDLVEPTRKRNSKQPTWKLTGEQLLRLGAEAADLKEIALLSGGDDIAGALHSEQTIVELKTALASGPVDVHTLQDQLWPGDTQAAEKLNALVALGSKVCDDAKHPVLSARYHLFVRATEGAFVSFRDAGPRVFLGRHEVDPETGRAVFEFGTCNRCGAVHLAGTVEHRGKDEFFVPTKKAEGLPHWLVLADSEAETLVDEDELILAHEAAKGEEPDPTTRRLCTTCGLLADVNATTCPSSSCNSEQMLLVREHPRAARVISRCTECGSRSRQGIRRLRTDVNAAPAVVTTALYQQLPESAETSGDKVGGGRKLLMFSDSRQAAAFAAPYLDRTYSRLLERRYITQALQDPDSARDELTIRGLSIITREKASAANHFPNSMGNIEIEQAINHWVMGELITHETRLSLEGLGLMRVALRRDDSISLRGFTRLGLNEDEAWALLNELVKSARLQGAVTLLERVNIQDERFAPRNTRVRMRSTGSDASKNIISWKPSGRPGTTNNRITFLRKVLAELSNATAPHDVLGGCWDLLNDAGYLVAESERTAEGIVFQLDHKKLVVTNGLACTWYICDTCRLVTAFSVRSVCPNSRCTGTLNVYRIPSLETDTNHYRVLYQTMNTAPLSAREHTAQWDAKQAARIQREFITGKVNVLSCSTTFELGVDVGDLQSVVMRNMPPKTANYVQRAGRAGRRASSAALVVTYANRSAHDLAKYQDPYSMIAGQMRIPWIPIDNSRIARRHAHSIALAAYFRHCYDDRELPNAGTFFSASADRHASPAADVVKYLTPVPPHVSAALRAALPAAVQAEIGILDGSWVDQLRDLLTATEKEVQQDIETFEGLITEAVQKRNFGLSKRLDETLNTIKGRELLGFLANRNILPKYGFPVDTVELRTLHSTDPTGRNLELARDLSLAIYEYAPGNEIVAGGKVWTSAGLRKRPDRELDRLYYRICHTCRRFQCGRERLADDLCPSCNEPYGAVRQLVLPEYGFVAAMETRDVGTAPPERRWHGASFVETIGDEVGAYVWSSPGGLQVKARAGTRAWLAVISDGLGDGFQLCQWCGWAQASERGSRRRKHKRPESGKECDGPLERVTLGHRYQSDVAEFTFNRVPYHRDQESIWLSTLYAILEGASEALEISRDDIDGALAWSTDHRRSIVLFDTVPGGAGAAKRIAENIERVLRSAVERVRTCDCGEETSCYGCLRAYRNARFHEELSRGAALQMLSGELGV
ncbi:DEAD/DEAH box helicase [Mycobacterium heckeshornense]|uniref:DEAD/DEAH box helicase n=1 Tax=Mycobacterium heckeshornense TaxID=110505 RepID=UPI003083F9F5